MGLFGRNWEPATAKIIAAKFHRSSDAAGTWEYVADITPASGTPAFRATLNQPRLMSHVVWLHEGDVVGALADVRGQRAKFDRSDPKVNGKAARTRKERFDEALAEPPGSPPPS